MFLLGHMCWAYVTARSCSSALKVSINPYLVLLLGALPDIDLLLGSYGIEHRTITHSLFFWSMAFVPIFIRYRKRSIPYFIAPIQHILLGDFVVGHTDPFWPLAHFELGLGLRLLSIENVALEAIGLAIFLIWVNRNGDSKILLRPRRQGLLSVIAILPLASFLLFVQSDLPTHIVSEHLQVDKLERSAKWIIRSDAFLFVAIMHLVLLAFLSISLIQGSRALIYKKAKGKQE